MLFSEMRMLCVRILLLSAVIQLSRFQRSNNETDRMLCDCMGYWQCILNDGVARGMCPMSSNFCCFVPTSSRHLFKPIRQLKILPTPAVEQPTQKKACGQQHPNSVVDGEAEVFEWSWHAAILEQREDLYVCGASLFHDRWLLTAAHCIDKYRSAGGGISGKLKARLGEFDVTKLTEPVPHQELKISRVLIHPLFDNSTLMNDIALVQLSERVRTGKSVRRVCLPDKTPQETVAEPGKLTCVVTGWGRLNETTPHATVLKEIVVPLWDLGDCQKALRTQFGPQYRLPSSAICAGDKERDACDGDGGGPLVCRQAGVWVQHGVVSFGIGCGRAGVPGVYTRVSAFVDWINRVVYQS